MKYLLMLCGTAANRERQIGLTAEAYRLEFDSVVQWLHELGPRLVSSGRLQPPSAATTVRFDGEGTSTVTDGPFIEAREMIGGFAVIDVADRDEALRVACAWPARDTVEVRPLIET